MIFIANWKNYLKAEEMSSWIRLVKDVENVEQIILAPYPYLYFLSKKIDGKKIILGSQGVMSKCVNNFTSIVDSYMIKDAGVDVVCLGHKESLTYFKQSFDDILMILPEVISYGMRPLLCISQHELNGDWLDKIAHIDSEIMVAYEPSWAIGGVDAISNCELVDNINFLKAKLSGIINHKLNIKWIYGGSVDFNNISRLISCNVLDGFLLGRASVNIDNWYKIISCYH